MKVISTSGVDVLANSSGSGHTAEIAEIDVRGGGQQITYSIGGNTIISGTSGIEMK